MANHQLKNIDPEDIEDVLLIIEKSFNIQFAEYELRNIDCFGGLCDHIIGKINLAHKDDCTTQQAFYKLRNGISTTCEIEKTIISPKRTINEFLPRKGRIKRMQKLEKSIGFKLNIMRPQHWISNTLAIIAFLSFLGLFYNWQIALCGIIFSILGFWIASKTGRELDITTLGKLTKKITSENYLVLRKTPDTFNRNEIEKLLIELFSEHLSLSKDELTREARLV